MLHGLLEQLDDISTPMVVSGSMRYFLTPHSLLVTAKGLNWYSNTPYFVTVIVLLKSGSSSTLDEFIPHLTSISFDCVS